MPIIISIARGRKVQVSYQHIPRHPQDEVYFSIL
jgi:hypothetical protein